MHRFRLIALLAAAFSGALLLECKLVAAQTSRAKPVKVSPACARQLKDIKELFSAGRSVVQVPEAGMTVSVDYDAKLLPLVIDYLDSAHPEVVIAACNLATAHQGNPLLVPRLTQLLDHKNHKVRGAAAFGLCSIGVVDDNVARAAVARLVVAKRDFELIGLLQLLGCYHGGNVDVASVLDGILRRKPAHDHAICVETVRTLARSGGTQGKAKAAATLGKIVDCRLQVDSPLPKGIPYASADETRARRVRSEYRNELRYEAIIGLGELGVASPEVVAVLTDTLKDMTKIRETDRIIPSTMRVGAHFYVEYTLAGVSAEALGKLAAPAKSALPKLKNLYGSHQLTLSDDVCVAGAIARLDEKNETMIRLLIAYAATQVQDDFKSAHCACEAMLWLGRIGPRAAPAVDPLLKILDSKDHAFRYYSAETLWRIARRPEAVKALVELLSCDNRSEQSSAAYMLGELGAAARPALPALRTALDDSDPHVRSAALNAIKQIISAKDEVLKKPR